MYLSDFFKEYQEQSLYFTINNVNNTPIKRNRSAKVTIYVTDALGWS